MEGIYARFKNQLSDFFEKISSGLSDPKTLRKVTKKYHFLSLPRRPNRRRLRRRHTLPCNLLTNSKKPAIRPLFGLIRPKSAAESGGGCSCLSCSCFGPSRASLISAHGSLLVWAYSSYGFCGVAPKGGSPLCPPVLLLLQHACLW